MRVEISHFLARISSKAQLGTLKVLGLLGLCFDPSVVYPTYCRPDTLNLLVCL